jgi:ABC-type branched-subunit amino acid transport system ATPase component
LESRAILEVRDLHSFYGNAHVICGASLTVAAGEVVALLGRNGMGKTTLIRSIMGLTPPLVRSGDIRWRGRTLLGLRPHAVAARRIAIVPRSPSRHRIEGCRAASLYRLDKMPPRRPPALVQMPYHCQR